MSEEKKEPAFEDALKQLEGIVAEMEQGNLGLDDCLKKFEQGQKLASFCTGKLGEAEKKIEVLLRETDKGPEWNEM